MNKNYRLIDINNKLKDVINKLFYYKYDHSWLKYIYINPNIINYQYYYIYFKNQFIKTINKDDLYDENILTILIDDIIDSIKSNQIKLTIYHLPDILQINKSYDVLYCKQSCVDELNSFYNNDNIYIKFISKKLYQIDFCIEGQYIFFYIKHVFFFKCDINNIDKCIKNNELFIKYRNLEKEKIKIYFRGNFKLYYDDKFIKYMFLKGYWIDYAHLTGNEIEYVDICFKNDYFSYYYYDIIIYDSTMSLRIFDFIKDWNKRKLFHNLKMIEQKMFIILRTCLNFDIFISTEIEHIFTDKNKCIYLSKPNMFNDDIILKTEKRPYIADAYPNKDIIKFINILDKECNLCNLDITKYSFNNNICLSRDNFFKNYNLDPNKKLITIFLTWPSLDKNENAKDLIIRTSFEIFIIKYNNFLLELCKSFMKNNCNIIFQIHPREGICCYPHKDIKIDITLDKRNDNIYLLKEIQYLNKKMIFVDRSYTVEVNRYTDYGILLSGTSVGYFNYLYDFPVLCISTKNSDYDWFKSIELFLKEYYYGTFIYYEDILNNIDNIVEQFLNCDHKGAYRYFNKHPFYGDSYSHNYKNLGDKIINLIKNNNINNSSKDIKLLIEPTYITIYDNKNIKLELINNEIILHIINIPKNNYGISIKVFENINVNKCNLNLDCRLDEDEDNVNLRVYTGKKWVQLNETIIKTYKKFKISEEFDFYSKSKWRISTTSFKSNQTIFIKNIYFIQSDI